MKTIGQRIYERRVELGLTQTELAKKAGLKSAGAIGNYESQSRGKPRNLLNLAKALGVTAEWLETGKEPKEPSASVPAQFTADSEEFQLLKFFGAIVNKIDRQKVLSFTEGLAVTQRKSGDHSVPRKVPKAA